MAEIVVLENHQAVMNEAATQWVKIAQDSVAETGRFTIALSGGNTPRQLYQLMAEPQWVEQMPWDKTYVFWGDEQRVPHTHERSSYKMTKELLLDHVPVPPEQVFPMAGTGLGGSAARDYENYLWKLFRFGSREYPQLDLVLLGMGLDGHFASIFPGTRAASDLSNKVIVYNVPQLNEERMTMTIPVFNQAKNIMILITGEGKADMLNATLHGERRPSTYPLQSIQPAAGTLTYLIDEGAASKLPK